jgi:hypothetical protein
MNEYKLPEPEFQLKWHSSPAAYRVSKPNIGDTDVYTAEQMQAAYAAGLDAPQPGRSCKVGGSCIAGKNSACACSELPAPNPPVAQPEMAGPCQNGIDPNGELFTIHDLVALTKPKPIDCRGCEHYYNCKLRVGTATDCTNGDKFQALPKVMLYMVTP